jgi:integrase
VFEEFELRALASAFALPLKEFGGAARDDAGDVVYLGLYTGQRQGDRLALTSAGRDDAGRRLFRQKKTGAIVAIPSTPQLDERLNAAAERRKALGIIDPHVVMNERRRCAWSADRYGTLFRIARRAACYGVVKIDGELVIAGEHGGDNYDWVLAPCPKRQNVADDDPIKSLDDLRDQDLRDTAVTWLARAECTPYEIASITGHSFANIHSILKHYLALHPEMADSAIAKLVKFMQQRGMVA